jgi:hypothetical protein
MISNIPENRIGNNKKQVKVDGQLQWSKPMSVRSFKDFCDYSSFHQPNPENPNDRISFGQHAEDFKKEDLTAIYGWGAKTGFSGGALHPALQIVRFEDGGHDSVEAAFIPYESALGMQTRICRSNA